MKARRIHDGGVFVFTPDIYRDPRGVFYEGHRVDEISKFIKMPDGALLKFIQSNVSVSKHCVLRGLHYQLRQDQNEVGQGKLIRCVFGKICQVSVDVRRDSKTFGTWITQVLDDVLCEAVWVPPGFANGFYVTDMRGAVVHYDMTQVHRELLARELLWNDGQVGIKWPPGAVVASPKDRAAKRLGEIERWS